MKKVTFSCFNNFSCIKEDCKHNCCIGWEILIDKKTLKTYKKVKGDFSKKLCKGVDFDSAKFRKSDNGRCYFLNECNLCDIILNLGGNSLSQVCSLHPRFRNFFSDRIEEGVGLCCEKACELLFDENSCLDFNEQKIKGFSRRLKPFEKEILNFRTKVLEIVLDEQKNFENKIEELCKFINVDVSRIYNLDIKNLFLSIDRLNNSLYDWIEEIEDVKKIKLNDSKQEELFTKLLWYFVIRHLPNSIDSFDLRSRTVFSLLSVIIIYNVCNAKEINKDRFLQVVREYSQEVEYSNDNINTILDKTDGVLI